MQFDHQWPGLGKIPSFQAANENPGTLSSGPQHKKACPIIGQASLNHKTNYADCQQKCK
jgi:hypothetical protein